MWTKNLDLGRNAIEVSFSKEGSFYFLTNKGVKHYCHSHVHTLERGGLKALQVNILQV